MISAAGMVAASMLVTYPFSPASFRARSSAGLRPGSGLPLAFFTNRVVFGLLLPGDDLPGAVLLAGECLVVTCGALALSRPTLPATTRDGCSGSQAGSAFFVTSFSIVPGVLRGDGVDDLPVVERVPVPAEVGRQVDGCFRGAGADDEPQVRLLAASVQISRRQHARVCDHDHVRDAVTSRELLDDRDDGQRLGLVALKAADLQGESVPVDEQADHDLRAGTALLGVARPCAARPRARPRSTGSSRRTGTTTRPRLCMACSKQTVAIWSRYLPDVARVRVRRIVFSLAGTCVPGRSGHARCPVSRRAPRSGRSPGRGRSRLRPR